VVEPNSNSSSSSSSCHTPTVGQFTLDSSSSLPDIPPNPKHNPNTNTNASDTQSSILFNKLAQVSCTRNLHQILMQDSCTRKKLVQESMTYSQVSCTSRLVQVSCTRFSTVYHQHNPTKPIPNSNPNQTVYRGMSEGNCPGGTVRIPYTVRGNYCSELPLILRTSQEKRVSAMTYLLFLCRGGGT